MRTANKDKRTKEQLLQILSNTLIQEEQLGEKIKMLENELAVCRQQKEDSRAGINEYGLSATKESFRIDYYKTTEQGRLKGIIEHLPTRQKKSFKGLGIKLITQFIEPFLSENVLMDKPDSADLAEEKHKVPAELEEPAAFGNIQSDPTVSDLIMPLDSSTAPVKITNMEGSFPTSSLVERLRMQMKNEQKAPIWGNNALSLPNAVLPVSPSRYTERLMSKIIAAPALENKMAFTQPEPVTVVSGSTKTKLLERLQLELRLTANAAFPAKRK